MKGLLKLALGVGIGAYIVFGASAGALAAYRGDSTNGSADARETRIAVWSSVANRRLIFINEMLYPDVAGADSATCAGDICLVP
jgi:hypothetical protein